MSSIPPDCPHDNPRLEAALEYARLGFRVGPLHSWSAEHGCSCGKSGCSKPGVHPRIGGPNSTREERLLKVWWREWPDANVGIFLKDGLFALDVAPQGGGEVWLGSLERQHGPLQKTPTVRIGDGGEYKIFKHAGEALQTARAVAPGIDVYGEGACIPVPPSVDKHGPYQWSVDPREVAVAHAADYLIRTLTECAESKPTTSPRLRLIPADEFANLPPREMLVESILPVGGLAVLWGQPGTFKTFLALDLALSIATGRAWCDHAVRQGAVVYIAAEGVGAFPLRVKAWKRHHGVAELPGAFILPAPVQIRDGNQVGALLAEVRQLAEKVAFIVVDTLARCFVGGDENTTKEMGLLVAGLDTIRERTAATVLVVHHSERSGKHERGSNALPGAADTAMRAKAGPDGVILECTKQKDGAGFPALHFRRHVVELEDGNTLCVLVPVSPEEMRANQSARLSAAKQRMLELLRTSFDGRGATETEWRKAYEKEVEAEANDSTFRNWATQLVEGGHVEKHGEGRGARYVLKVATGGASANGGAAEGEVAAG